MNQDSEAMTMMICTFVIVAGVFVQSVALILILLAAKRLAADLARAKIRLVSEVQPLLVSAKSLYSDLLPVTKSSTDAYREIVTASRDVRGACLHLYKDASTPVRKVLGSTHLLMHAAKAIPASMQHRP
jgi:hypothetical protein